jgi:spoIIIJ-associated protein
MIKEIVASGKDVIEAKENARLALGVGPLDDVNFEVIHAGSKGIFGIIGVKPAQVRAYIELPDVKERRQKDRPKREKREESAEATRREGKNHGKRRGDKKPNKANDSKDSKPKSEVIPEAELKMELRTVSEGEDMSFDFVKTVIADIGLSATAELYACEDDTRRIIIAGDDASVLIGHHGETLDALQYLANLASARKNINGERDKSRVTLDIEGYRKKREETLRALARRKASVALKTGRSVMLEPMSAYERRIIHSEIQNIEGVSTNSIGSDNNRKIVIFLTDKRPKGLFEEADASEAANDVAESADAMACESCAAEASQEENV